MTREMATRIGENLLLAISLFLLIPPIPSIEGQKYSFFPLGLVAIVAFTLSRILACRRNAETVYSILFQVIVFVIYGFISHERAIFSD
jgi:hypothetical protein